MKTATQRHRFAARVTLMIATSAMIAAGHGCAGGGGGGSGGSGGRAEGGSVGVGAAAKADAPLSAIADSSARSSEQIAAVRRMWDAVEAGELNHAAARESLKKVVWARSRWSGVREAAIETLLHDEANLDDTRNMLRLMLPTETQWVIIEYVCNLAAERGWTDLTPALVRSWARPVPKPSDNERPERIALEALHPGMEIEQVVFGVFAGGSGEIEELRERDRRDAWSLLRRIDPQGHRTIAMLSAPAPGADTDPWAEALRIAARELGVIPDTGEQLAWLSQLRSPAYASDWAQATSAVAALSPEQRQGLQLRHLSAMVWAAANRPHWLGSSRDQLMAEAQSALKGRRKHSRATGRSGTHTGSQLLSAWRSKLTWGDLLTVLVALDATGRGLLAAPLFDQVDVDRRDTSTEHGGVVDGTADGFALRAFAPRPAQRMGDRQFSAPAEMIEQSPGSIFHYHFHVQRTNNGDYAGPSGEDIEYAARFGRACIVFTSINADTLNADYYQGDGVVIDLGEVKRPAASQ